MCFSGVQAPAGEAQAPAGDLSALGNWCLMRLSQC